LSSSKRLKIIDMENQNSVCYVGHIGDIIPILGADNIELVLVSGWQAITKKGEYTVGDKVVVATTDAVIPEALSELMEVTNYLRKGQRVRTVKLRGVYSESLLIPFKYLAPKSLVNNVKEGDDMMEILGVTKYEPPVKQIQLSSGRKIKYKDNPNFGVYYKFPNLKNVSGMFTGDDVVEITRKIHGTNARYGIVKKSKLSLWDKVKRFFGNEWAGYDYIYGSHNVEKGSDSQGFYSTDVWRTTAERYKIKEKLWDYVNTYLTPEDIGSGIIIYGEIYGAGIQKNYEYGLKDMEFVGFDLVQNGKYVDVLSTKYIIKYIIELPYVEIVYKGLWSQEVQDEYVFNNFIEGTKVPHEGIVIKHINGQRNKVAKVINPDYLIYGEKHNVGDSH
jgi:RNA ligase (TIGR02306 family)